MNNTIYFGFNKKPATKEEVFQEVPKGWENIVSRLIDQLFEKGWNGELFQIKEKFGTLRFYTNKTTDEQQKLIDAAEEETESVCAKCGKPATKATKGWRLFLCDDHYNEVA